MEATSNKNKLDRKNQMKKELSATSTQQNATKGNQRIMTLLWKAKISREKKNCAKNERR